MDIFRGDSETRKKAEGIVSRAHKNRDFCQILIKSGDVQCWEKAHLFLLLYKSDRCKKKDKKLSRQEEWLRDWTLWFEISGE